MEHLNSNKKKRTSRTIVVYLGSAWVVIEAINFLIDKYKLNSGIIDIIIWAIVFGLPAAIIYSWFNQKFTKRSIILQLLNALVAILVLSYNIANPHRFNPTELRLLRFKDNQKKLTSTIESIAVLPFSNYMGDEKQIYLVDGMHDAIISELGQLGTIRIISRTSTLPYKNSHKTIKEIATELNVDAIIEAAVYGENDKIRLQLKLINAFPEELQLWSQTIDSDLRHLLDLYSNISKNIADEIQLTLSAEQQSRINSKREVNPEAYKLYLQGRYHWYKFTQEDLEIAANYFEQAIEIDRNYALAYVGYADAISTMAHIGFVEPGNHFEESKAALQTALSLDTELAEAHDFLARTQFAIDWDWIESEKEFKRAIELNPNLGDARIVYSQFLIMMGRFEESINESSYCIRLNPFHPWFQEEHARRLFYKGDFQESTIKYQELLENFPKYFEAHKSFADILYVNEFYKKSLESLLNHFTAIEDSIVIGILKKGIPTTSNKQGYENVLKLVADTLSFRSKEVYVKSSEIARYYILAGEQTESLKWLGRALEERDSQLVYVINNPVFDPIFNDPIFLNILSEMNLDKEILIAR